MIYVAVLAFVLLAAVVTFVLTHLQPLSPEHISVLARERRASTVRSYYAFSSSPALMDLDFKKRMQPGGELHAVSSELRAYPSIAASHLKYKKHEWVIVAFEKDRTVHLAWLNKGEATAVSPNICFEDLLSMAVVREYSSMLIFHNHPNSLPGRHKLYNTLPSKPDQACAEEWSQTAAQSNVNTLHFVCDRGCAYPYRIVCADSFLPLVRHMHEVMAANGQSRMGNLRLHIERIFGKGKERLALLGDY